MSNELERTNRKQDQGAICEGKERYIIDVTFTETPKPKRQVEILQSPFYCSFKKDLFSQLLGSDAKENANPLMLLGLSGKRSDHSSFECVEEIPMDMCEEKFDDSDSEIDLDENEEIRALRIKDDLLRKRKRKSTAQLKVLKNQFDKRQGEWSKDKIVKMAQLTGLSQSQVYKWCWDQKKKNDVPSKYPKSQEGEDESDESEELSRSSSHFLRTKLINKDSRTLTKKKTPQLCFKNQTVRKRY